MSYGCLPSPQLFSKALAETSTYLLRPRRPRLCLPRHGCSQKHWQKFTLLVAHPPPPPLPPSPLLFSKALAETPNTRRRSESVDVSASSFESSRGEGGEGGGGGGAACRWMFLQVLLRTAVAKEDTCKTL